MIGQYSLTLKSLYDKRVICYEKANKFANLKGKKWMRIEYKNKPQRI
ncbi:hypothetical protein GCM10007380_12450 [Gottfriedia solisilvae]|uniref:Uncharacterized protein n=1 Tax=Gottfriedia solisilvae TaxID=1516104 RepID=A0A8J3AGD1_9BACI|nr:hypothetical protein GCM10007380_12450 [Gottfriedia solisilvae]